MIRIIQYVLGIIFACASFKADACSLIPVLFEDKVKRAASESVLIEGTLIQAFDAANRKPEIIRSKKIFVGDGKPRDFIIYRDHHDYELALDQRIPRTTCYFPPPAFKVGQHFDRIVLTPARILENGIVEDRWLLGEPNKGLAEGNGLKALLDQAARQGRLRERPRLAQGVESSAAVGTVVPKAMAGLAIGLLALFLVLFMRQRRSRR